MKNTKQSNYNKQKQHKKSHKMKPKGQKQSSNNPFSRLGIFHTITRFSAAVSLSTTVTTLRVDVIPTLDLFPL